MDVKGAGYGNAILLKNTTTGNITDVILGNGSCVEFTWSDGTPDAIDVENEDPQVRGCDGVHVLKGSFTHGSGAKLDWTIYMRKRH